MTIDDAHLLAYVDGTLPRALSAEVERAVRESVDIATRVARLRASQFSYAEIFSRQMLPALPASLKLRVDGLIATR